MPAKNKKAKPRSDERDIKGHFTSAIAARFGALGGRNRVKRLTAARRSEIAHNAAQARWKPSLE